MIDNDVKQQVLGALADSRFTWRTVHGVAKQTGLPEATVFKVISDNTDDIVQSSVPSTSGSILFTTREHFNEKGTVAEKIIGAFKGRVR